MPAQHKLFRDFPMDGSTDLSTGRSPTPYHVYDGHGLLVTGIANLDVVKETIKDESVYLVTTDSGHAAMGIFVCDFQEASHGSHLELQVCVLVSETPGGHISDHPFAMPAAMATRSDWGTLCLHLWNDTANVVAYNSEYLGLNASLATGKISQARARKSFEFTDEKARPILLGNVAENRRSGLRSLARFTRVAGLAPLIRANRRPYFESAVINLKGDVFQENLRARAFTAPDRMVLQIFNPVTDDITFKNDTLAGYEFQPLCLEHLTPFRFAYLHPLKPQVE